MAQSKIKFTEADQKKLKQYIKNLPPETFKEDRLYEKEYYHSPGRDLYRRRFAERGLVMSDKINHCKSGGGTMSECSACKLRKDSEKHKSQKACAFYKKNTHAEKCRFETFGEYCWSVDAQKDSKG